MVTIWLHALVTKSPEIKNQFTKIKINITFFLLINSEVMTMAYYIDTSSFAGRIDELNDTLTDDLVSSSAQVIQVNNELQNLKQIREIAYKNLSNFLDKLGYGTDVEAGMIALNDAINRFHALTFNFNSEALRENIINPARGIAVNKIKLEANRLKKLIKQDETRIPQLFNKLIAQTVENL